VTLAEARTTNRHRLETRQAAFLVLADRHYRQEDSQYRVLLTAAGCELRRGYVATGWHCPPPGGRRGAYVLTTPSNVGSPRPGENASRGAA
jgi:hypothetical protein